MMTMTSGLMKLYSDIKHKKENGGIMNKNVKLALVIGVTGLTIGEIAHIVKIRKRNNKIYKDFSKFYDVGELIDDSDQWLDEKSKSLKTEEALKEGYNLIQRWLDLFEINVWTNSCPSSDEINQIIITSDRYFSYLYRITGIVNFLRCELYPEMRKTVNMRSSKEFFNVFRKYSKNTDDLLRKCVTEEQVTKKEIDCLFEYLTKIKNIQREWIKTNSDKLTISLSEIEHISSSMKLLKRTIDLTEVTLGTDDIEG